MERVSAPEVFQSFFFLFWELHCNAGPAVSERAGDGEMDVHWGRAATSRGLGIPLHGHPGEAAREGTTGSPWFDSGDQCHHRCEALAGQHKAQYGEIDPGWSMGQQASQNPGKKIWPTAADNLLLEVRLGDMSLFWFPEAEMASNYVPGDTTKNSIIIAGQDGTQRVVEEDKPEAACIGDFCLWTNCYMAKSISTQGGVWLVTTILI
jgi:hypothetical protein